MMRFKGTFDRAIGLADKLQALAANGYQDATHRSAVAVQLQLDKQYAAGKSPAGQTWKNKRDGKRSYLQRSGSMARNTSAVRGVRGVDVSAPKPAGFHQKGTRRMTQRRIVPDGFGTAPAWSMAVTRACSEAIRGALK